MQASLPDSGGQPSVREELQSPLAGPQVQEQPTAAITSYEVNALLHNYLQETG